MTARPGLCLWLAVLGCLAATVTQTTPVLAEDRLRNGGFESGTSNWAGTGLSSTACPARSGSGAAALVVGSSQHALIQQTISDAAGQRHRLEGFVRLHSGTASVKAFLSRLDSSGTEVLVTLETLTLSADYEDFGFSESSVPPDTTRLRVKIVATGGPATICLDDLSLEGPPPATATPVPTPTLTPTATATVASTAEASPTATSLPSSTETPLVVDTATPRPTATRQSAAAMRFINGDFEDSLDGWDKFGGELATVSTPRRGGARAGALRSETTSTKWAYQLVEVDRDRAYEFAGHVLTDAGVSRAYLRISWYESSDGSGEAFGTDDSTEDVRGASGTFVPLTTGSRTPPPGARSARVRVVLTPVEGNVATVYMDDFSFGNPSAVPPQAPAPGAAAAVIEASPTPPVLTQASASPTATSLPATRTPLAAPTPTAFSQVASLVQTTRPSTSSPPPARLELEPEDEPGEGLDLPRLILLVIGAAFAVGGFGGAYFYERFRRN